MNTLSDLGTSRGKGIAYVRSGSKGQSNTSGYNASPGAKECHQAFPYSPNMLPAGPQMIDGHPHEPGGGPEPYSSKPNIVEGEYRHG